MRCMRASQGPQHMLSHIPTKLQGVKGLLVISAGFGEAGPEGTERQAELLQIASEFRMRIVGPNSLGFLTADPTVRLNATFVDTCVPQSPPANRPPSTRMQWALAAAPRPP